MKTLFNLPRNLRVFFGVCRLLTAIGGGLALPVWFIASLAPPEAGLIRSVIPLSFDEVALKIPAGSVSIKSDTSGSSDIRISRLSGDIAINLRSSDPELVSAIRWTLLPKYIVGFVVSWLLFGQLRNLCARIEQGEVFSEANLRSVRNVGLLFVIFNLTDGAFLVWSAYRLGGYLAKHTTITGLNAGFETGLAQLHAYAFGDLITGLLILLVAEAFRQGLALKKENELTV